MAARTLNVLLGIWLFISAFIWPHTSAQMTNTWILGVLCVVFALIATKVDQVRFLNTALAIWLFVSAFVLTTQSAGTRWNNALVAIAVFIISLAPPDRLQLPNRTPRTV
ncbi:MAG: SPW repeat protein [Myxococcales bacterium]|nr:SPW repeat protein [Myxococcales bacterium]